MERRKYRLTLLFFLLITLFLAKAQGANAQPSTEEVLSAVVRVDAEVPANARTAAFLGQQRTGSGVVIDKQGHILTIGYLVMEAHTVIVSTASGRQMTATVIANDSRSGVALLGLKEPLDVTPIRFGESAGLKERTEAIIASGSTMAPLQPTLVTSRRTFAGYWEYLLEDAIFTAPPHPQYAGAALIGKDGKLLGIGSLLVNDALPGRKALAGNMFVPIDRLKPILSGMIVDGRTKEEPLPWVGLFTEEFRDKLIVMFVAPNGPAEKAGMKTNDLVLEVANRPIKNQADFYVKMWNLGRAGTAIPLTVLQGTEIRHLTIESTDRSMYYQQPLPNQPIEELQST